MIFERFFTSSLYWNPLYCFWIIIIAFFLDYLFPAPEKIKPIKWIQLIVTFLENKLGKTSNYASILIAFVSVCFVLAFVTATLSLPFGIGEFFAIFWAWTSLSFGRLLRDAYSFVKQVIKVEDICKLAMKTPALKEKAEPAIDGARQVIEKLTGYKTTEADISSLYRLFAEFLSGRFLFDLIGPLFWLILTGPVGMIFYCFIYNFSYDFNSVHESKKTTKFFSSIFDIINWIPARLSVFVLLISAPFAKIPINWPGWSRLSQQAVGYPDKSAVWPISAIAWLHAASLGGKIPSDPSTNLRPALGISSGTWDNIRTTILLKHLRLSSIVGAVSMVLLSSVVIGIFI